MNKRQQEILAAIIEEYTDSAVPVGSKILVEKYGFDLSPATIRNDMVKLEEDGYLHQPHISAGRIPTDKGYKYFVEEIMGDTELSLADQKKLQAELLKLKAQHQRLSRTTAKLLSGMSGNLAISTMEKDFSDFGIRELLEKPEFQEMDEFCKVVDALDYIDENVDFILKNVKEGETKIFIGKDNPIKGINNCSMVVSPYMTKSGDRGVLAIIGPKRMKYAENKSLLNYVRKLLSTSAVVVLVIGNLYQ
ncbi:MAG: DeoR family transcriptional regulator [Candidatus Moranbacteria bacterium]|nr:DeoR family transcriptional regulator [Candidatus Moranbacteria bacterium]